MLDTLIYIPTVLAYTFISLLVVILCFIVVYVSHKVYLNIYDILPVTGNISKTVYKTKSPSALRIYIWIGPSRLAVVVLQPLNSRGTRYLLKFTDSISAIPWNDRDNNTGSMKNGGECNYQDTDHCGEYVT